MSYKKYLPEGLSDSDRNISLSGTITSMNINASLNVTGGDSDLVSDSDSWKIELRDDDMPLTETQEESSLNDTVLIEPKEADLYEASQDDELQDTMLLDGSNKLDYNSNNPPDSQPNANVDKSDSQDEQEVVSNQEKVVVNVSQVSPEISDLTDDSSQEIIPPSPVKTPNRKRKLKKKVVDTKVIQSSSDEDGSQLSSITKTPVQTGQCPICMREMNCNNLVKHSAECYGLKETR